MVNLEDTLNNFERRLNAIEAKLNQSGTNLPTQPRQYYNPIFNIDTTQNNDKPINSSAMLAGIGIIFVILAGIFFIKIAIDSGWLTPVRQIFLAATAGLTFFFIPQFFPKVEKEYGAWLAGAGTTILHLTWMGAYFVHHVIDANSALICTTLVGLFAMLANFDYGNRTYALIAMAGTYLAAPIIGYHTGEFHILAIFLIIWNVTFSTISFINKRRDILFIASYYAIFTALLLSGNIHGYAQQVELLVLQNIQFLIFSTVMVVYSAYYNNPLSQDESKAILPLLLLFYFASQYNVSNINPSFAPWFGILIAVLVLVAYLFAKTFISRKLKSHAVITSFIAIAFVHSFYFQILSDATKPLLGLLIGVAVVVIGNNRTTAIKPFLGALVVLLSAFIYGAVLTIGTTNPILVPMYFYNFAYGIFILFSWLKIKSKPEILSDTNEYSLLLFGFAHVEIMLGFYRLAEYISWYSTFLVTVAWGVYSILILSLAYLRRDKILGNSALIILLAVSLKALFYDVSNSSNLIRVVCLLTEGLLLYCCGWVFKKMQSWGIESNL